METVEEFERNNIVAESLYGMRACLLDLRDELMDIGVPINAIYADNWKEFDRDDVHVRVWDGEKHIKGTGKPGSTYMTALDVIALVKRRQILRRKF